MAYPTNDSILSGEIKSVTLEKLLLAFTTIIPEYPAIGHNAKVDVRELSYAVDQLALYVRSWVLDGHKVDRLEPESIDFPATPWDFWKQEHAPKWFLERWPVKYKTTVVNKNVHKHYVCPHVNVKTDDSMHFMWMARMKEGKE